MSGHGLKGILGERGKLSIKEVDPNAVKQGARSGKNKSELYYKSKLNAKIKKKKKKDKTGQKAK